MNECCNRISQSLEKPEVVKIFHHLEKLKFSPYQPKAFSEKGLYMLATILKSPKAVETTLMIIETFAKIRELVKKDIRRICGLIR